MTARKYIPPMSIVFMVVMTLVGTYIVRKIILDHHMVSALELRDDEAIARLIHGFPCPADVRTPEGRTPLHWACERGDAEAVRRLLSKGAKVNVAERSRDLRPDFPEILRDAWHVSPRHQLVEGRTSLHLAAADGRVEIVRLLLDAGADVNATSSDGWSALLLAAGKGNDPEVVGMLLAKGAKAGAKDEAGLTALHWAAEHHDLASAKMLLAAGAEVDAKDAAKWTPLIHAAATGWTEGVALLVGKGADVNAAGDGRTALLWAAETGQRDLAELLVSRGADVNPKTGPRKPLHWAAMLGDAELVGFLISQGADLDAKDYQGRTALDPALERNMTSSSAVLRHASFLKARSLSPFSN